MVSTTGCDPFVIIFVASNFWLEQLAGAGKTTTVSVMTGLYPPTSGDVSIYGHSIVKELHKARQSIGICPQHNVLFDRLTVMEHMTFFSKIKGVSIETEDLKARALELGLTEDQLKTTAAALSGGNKRKLSVAVALCGNPKFLILDEPTSAMDPTARRRTWQVLRKKRANRCILLTTHFMVRFPPLLLNGTCR
jgi:ATP-binding cassette, subfamily A (ABC1), member 3